MVVRHCVNNVRLYTGMVNEDFCLLFKVKGEEEATI